MARFVAAGRTSDLADGELTACEVDGRFIAVACVGGVYHAFDDTCTHRGCALSEGELDGTTVICPCHFGEFDVRTGEVVGGPPPDPVGTYAVRISGGEIEIEV
jgi:nitrite reductase/ring-hydroxylating ferredoxin subunit